MGPKKLVTLGPFPAEDSGGLGPSSMDGSIRGTAAPGNGAVWGQSGYVRAASSDGSGVDPDSGPGEVTIAGSGTPIEGPTRKTRGVS